MKDVKAWENSHDGVALSVSLRADPARGELLEVHATIEETGLVAIDRLFAAVRHASSRGELGPRGVEEAFRVEDIVSIVATVAKGDAEDTERWLRRRATSDASLHVERREQDGGTRVSATFARRGTLPSSQRKRYTREDGRIRVEAFELHVVEHCNLRCAHCCNMSPYVKEHVLSVDEIEAMCTLMSNHLTVDVFKIMGGEPLLHPDIVGALHAIRRSGISNTIRFFTNGLLLHRMGDDFWRALDELTISNYASAPVKPAHLELARDKARAFDVVLNVKPVAEFSEVMRSTRQDDDALTRRTYEGCWLRHRCLVVRRGSFYMCTRAAYADDYHRTLLHDAHPDDRGAAVVGDGVALATPDLGAALLAYLNRADPLASCRFCHGGAGPVVPHEQLSKVDVREGRFRPLRVLP